MRLSATATRICVLLVALSACAPSVGASQSGATVADEQSTSQGTAAETSTDQQSSSVLDTTESAAAAGTDSAGDAKSKGETGDMPRVKGPRPADLPFDLPVAVSSELSPLCAERGDEITMEVTTEPGAAIGYQAVYSDNGGGGAVPMGEGYGGNDRGYADDDGAFTSSWIVGLNAPSGPARVDLVVGYEGEFGYDDPHFAVADADGNCPEEWLAEKEN